MQQSPLLLGFLLPPLGSRVGSMLAGSISSFCPSFPLPVDTSAPQTPNFSSLGFLSPPRAAQSQCNLCCPAPPGLPILQPIRGIELGVKSLPQRQIPKSLPWSITAAITHWATSKTHKMLTKYPASYTGINFSCYSPNPSHHPTKGAPLNPSGFGSDPRKDSASLLSDSHYLTGPMIAA